MDAETIIKIISAVASFLFATLIPTIVLLIKKWKAYKEAKEEAAAAKTEAEKIAAEAEAEKIKNELLGEANSLIKEAETTYKAVDTILKNSGQAGVGAVKKDSVMTKIQAACIEKGVTFDADYWNAKVDELVALTKQVNSKGA